MLADLLQFYPGALFILSMFYTRKELAVRLAIFYTGNMIASSFAGLIAAGVFAGLDQKHGLAGWQWYVARPDSFRSTHHDAIGFSSSKAPYQSLLPF